MTNLEFAPNCTVVTGSAGRVGRALHCVWGGSVAGHPVLRTTRKPNQPADIAWDMGKSNSPEFPRGAIFLHLAGQTRGDAGALAENRRSAQALCNAADKSEAAHVFFMSSGAVYAASDRPITECHLAEPLSAYGSAKLEAEQEAQSILTPDRLTILRLGNLAGADAVLSAARLGPVVLDPIEGQPGGPERTYIGPRVLAAVIEALILRVQTGVLLPPILNVGQPRALEMADLLRAVGAEWKFGPRRDAAIPRVALCVDLLSSLVTVPEASAKSVVDDLASLGGAWP